MIWYVDASTYNNGMKGQDSSVLILKPDKTILRQHLGDYSVNYAELYAIREAALLAGENDEIISDSLIACNWIKRPLHPKQVKKLMKYVNMAETVISMIAQTQGLIKQKRLTVTHKLRGENRAGWEIEANPFYGRNTHETRLKSWKAKRKLTLDKLETIHAILSGL